MESFHFKIFVKLMSLLIRAVVWKEDSGGRLLLKLTAIEDEVGDYYVSKEHEPWITKG